MQSTTSADEIISITVVAISTNDEAISTVDDVNFKSDVGVSTSDVICSTNDETISTVDDANSITVDASSINDVICSTNVAASQLALIPSLTTTE